MRQSPAYRPTGSCFDDSMEMIDRIVKTHPFARPWTGVYLVHAICLIPGTNERFAHAWVEVDPTEAGAETKPYVMFGTLVMGRRQNVSTDRDDFYREMRVQEFTRYTVLEAADWNLRTYTFGPWEERYYALCADVMRSRAAAEQAAEQAVQWAAGTGKAKRQRKPKNGNTARPARKKRD